MMLSRVHLPLRGAESRTRGTEQRGSGNEQVAQIAASPARALAPVSV